MKNTTSTRTPSRYTQPLNREPALQPRIGITRPFPESPRRPCSHDMLMLNPHADLLPEPEQQIPLRDLTFFNLDRP